MLATLASHTAPPIFGLSQPSIHGPSPDPRPNGWDNFFVGMLSQEWSSIQHQYLAYCLPILSLGAGLECFLDLATLRIFLQFVDAAESDHLTPF